MCNRLEINTDPCSAVSCLSLRLPLGLISVWQDLIQTSVQFVSVQVVSKDYRFVFAFITIQTVARCQSGNDLLLCPLFAWSAFSHAIIVGERT